MMNHMILKKLDLDFTVCKVRDASAIDFSAEFCFAGKTDEEISLVCPTGSVPEDTMEREDGWSAFRIEGMLDFSLIGILAEIASLLAEHRISVFVVSTYNTDYIFVKKEMFSDALSVLSDAGYQVK